MTRSQFFLLGKVEAQHEGRRLQLGRRRERALLALLLLEPERVVAAERLADLLWDGDPPDSARSALHTHVSRLRNVLDPARDGRLGVRLHSRDYGYVAEVDPESVDVHRFTVLVRSARDLAGPRERAETLRAALSLWRGPALQECGSELFRRRVTVPLTELRLQATESAIEAELECGRQHELIGELTALTTEFPTRETLWAQLALALYRCDRQADALDALGRAREKLVVEFGLDLGPRLNRLRQQILNSDPVLRGGTPAVVPAPVIHRQIPADIADFTGRADELRHLLELADRAAETGRAGPPSIFVVEGMGGVGKTRLAVRLAHQLAGRSRFDEIQLWADLHGFHPERPPAEPAAVLGNLLRLLGVAAHDVPDDLETRAALFRDRLAGRRVLILLDDARSEEQVRPLLPGAGTCQVIITTRRTLTGLDGAHSVRLGSFSSGEAVELLRRYAGDERVEHEPAATLRLAELCGNLPLAVAVSARQLRARPNWRISELVAQLEAGAGQLGRLSPAARAVRVVFDLSYRALPSAHQRLFRLLAVHPGHDFAAPSVAALTGCTVPEAQAALDDLLDEHLLLPEPGGRYGIHDLVLHYLTEQTRRHDPAADRWRALERLTHHYLHRAQHATLLIHPTETRRVGAMTGKPPWPTAAEAVAWAEAEYDNLLATVHRAAEAPGAVPALALQLVAALYRPLANRGHSTDRIALNQCAVRIARRTANRHAEALALEDLGTLCGQVGLVQDSLAYSQQALKLWTELGDSAGRQGCLADLGNSYRQRGEFEKAVDHLERSLAISRESGDRRGEASVLNYLGLTHQGTGDFARAIDCLSRSASVFGEVGNALGEAVAVANRGWAYQRAGRPREAIPCHRRSLAVFDGLQDHYNAAEQHWALGQASHALGDLPAARVHWHTAIAMLRRIQAVDEQEAARLFAQDIPETPELIRLNT
ncbi:BTAD domain-containing putative transcriptional regulator [Amycolatopsis sacchari]|uniref:AfsR/SARP family transcriptional regulator n=1 Tax=Amycolatopsis sacchari TaxID=115433 RepID=UPI003D706428